MPGYHKLHLPASYRALVKLDARDFAWEWLRRNLEFRALWTEAAARASAKARIAGRRGSAAVVDIPQHPLAKRWSPWGPTFRARSRHAGN